MAANRVKWRNILPFTWDEWRAAMGLVVVFYAYQLALVWVVYGR